MLIPTTSKSQIGSGFSYPIGAEAITLALGDVPQAPRMKITFTSYAPHIRWNKKPVVASIQFRHFRPSIYTPRRWQNTDHLGPQWSIWVWAVKREVRHTVNGLLKDALARQARPWLFAHEHVSEGFLRFDLQFDPSTSVISCIDELHPVLTGHRL